MTASWALHLGDCAAPDGLASLEPGTVDALVTDPPAGIGFMGKDWDGDKGGRDAWVAWLAGIMRLCLRAMKPGAHGFVWALPRTSHWTATALEDAGFEIRDVVTHHFGTGFPKSLDVSKAIDAAAGAKREVVGQAENWGRTRLETGKVAESDFSGAWDLTAPATEAAKRWAGWGTALKPATEHWILVRKPLDGTVAANVQKHGTGGLNIDACRIAGMKDVPASPRAVKHPFLGLARQSGDEAGLDPSVGRWPANLVLSHSPACGESCAPGCPVAELDVQGGERAPGGALTGSEPSAKTAGVYNPFAGRGPWEPYNDTGGASRFFFTAKPSRSERDRGCASLAPTSAGEATNRSEGSAGLQSPRAGAGRTGGARNNHPTVKPIELMEWLIRLISPPGATLLILDPFTGSGTTGVAAIRLRHDFVGWEREPAYERIARKRLEATQPEPEQLGLFGGGR